MITFKNGLLGFLCLFEPEADYSSDRHKLKVKCLFFFNLFIHAEKVQD